VTPVRARDLGIPFAGTPGPWNAVTDVPGVEVGHVTRIEGEPSDGSAGPVIRTGVTTLFPLGKASGEGVAAGRFVLNGMGEMTGSVFLDEYRALYGPMALTNTLSVGVVRDAMIAWSRANVRDAKVLRGRTKPVVSETWDGRLNDVYGQHVTPDDAWRALDAAQPGPVPEGNVGGGTGMVAYGFKAGIGTASQRVEHPLGTFTLGVLVQANYGSRHDLRIAGVPVGMHLEEPRAIEPSPPPAEHGDGSIVGVYVTDAPLLPSQLDGVARRASLALGRLGSIAAASSGDLFLALSTANRSRFGEPEMRAFTSLPTASLDPVYRAAVDVFEEAVVNALIAAQAMTGVHGAFYPNLPHDAVRDLLVEYGRIA